MSDAADPCDELLASVPPAPDSAFRAALRVRTSRMIRLRWWLKRLAVLAVAGVVYVAGVLTPRPTPVVPPAPERPAAVEIESAPPPPTLPDAESTVEMEYRALESNRGRAELYLRAADRYLSEDDLASAARCYRLALNEGADPAVRSEDTWLMIAIKNARSKEKKNATLHP
jgi:hypothetical protein